VTNEAAVSLAYLNMTMPPMKVVQSPAPHAVAKARRWTSLLAAAAAELPLPEPPRCSASGAKRNPAARNGNASGTAPATPSRLASRRTDLDIFQAAGSLRVAGALVISSDSSSDHDSRHELRWPFLTAFLESWLVKSQEFVRHFHLLALLGRAQVLRIRKY
jgi:hypothetical protein